MFGRKIVALKEGLLALSGLLVILAFSGAWWGGPVAVEAQVPAQCVPLRCAGPEERGVCKARFLRYRFNPLTRACGVFNYGGCGGNENNFPSLEACRSNCITTPRNCVAWRCTLPEDKGLCTRTVPRFRFDPVTRSCGAFNYTGCGGNVNRFGTLQECNNVCTVRLRG